jgi:hypothetical protein
MRRSPIVALGLLALSGCGTNDNARGPDREATAGVHPVAPMPTAPEQRGWAHAPAPEPMDFTLTPPPEPERVIEERVEVPPTAPPETTTAPTRNLGDELREAVGDISSCLDVQAAAAAGPSLSISISVTALPSGHFQRASVSAGSLPVTSIDCIRARVEGASIAPVEHAPRTVSTTLHFTVSAHVTSETTTTFARDLPPPGHTQAPGVTLPALAPAGPSPGSVAPAHTLPARVP